MSLTSIERIKKLPEKNLASIGNLIIDEACIIANSPISYLFVTRPKSEDVLILLGWSKSVMDACKLIDKPILYKLEDTGLWGDCVRERKAIITNNYKDLKKSTKKGYPAGHMEIVRHLNLPIFSDNRIVGVLGVGNKDSNYDMNDVDSLQNFVNEAFIFFPQNELELIG